ncbi:hypothetical protein ACFCYN_14180 [Gottfriedia sp. NPDC056225]|uniref:hypothetical protein n=1 Tax=Gottfriedia sp. NPDC056225 TaxID=3345751 RepID=UPI0035DED4D3
MNVTIRKVSEEQTIIEVQTRNGIKELPITKTEFGYSYPDFAEWDISDKNYYDLEELVDNLGDKLMGKSSSLNISYGD